MIGSIYGVIKLVSTQLFDWLKKDKVKYVEIRPKLEGMCIAAATDTLIAQIFRLRGRGLNIKSEHIHQESVDWLRQAIDDKIEKDMIDKQLRK